MPAQLHVSGLPCGLPGPLRLIGLEPDGQADVRVREDCFGPSPRVAEVVIPLIAWVCDAMGCRHCGRTEATVCVSLPRACRGPGTFVAEAMVRLVDSECSCTCAFDACLSVRVDVYMVRMEPCGPGWGCGNATSLPMFPEPCC